MSTLRSESLIITTDVDICNWLLLINGWWFWLNCLVMANFYGHPFGSFLQNKVGLSVQIEVAYKLYRYLWWVIGIIRSAYGMLPQPFLQFWIYEPIGNGQPNVTRKGMGHWHIRLILSCYTYLTFVRLDELLEMVSKFHSFGNDLQASWTSFDNGPPRQCD